MVRREANHEGSAFSPELSESSQIPESCWRDAVALTWAAGLLLWGPLHATLFVDTTAFMRLAAVLDTPAVAWLLALIGYACVFVVTDSLRRDQNSERLPANPEYGTTRLVLGLLALFALSYHLLVLRWPWLSGDATADCRLTVWSAILSTTHGGMPLLAFGELMSFALLYAHAWVGLDAVKAWRGPAWRSARIVACVAASTGFLLCSAVVIALATGRR